MSWWNIIPSLLAAVVDLFRGSPNQYNPTNAQIENHRKMEREALELKEKMEKKAADTQILLKELQKQVEDAKEREKKAIQEEEEAKKRKDSILKLEGDAIQALENARIQLKNAEVKGEELEKLEKDVKEKQKAAERLADQSKQATLDAQRRESDAKASVLKSEEQAAEARKAADEAQKEKEKIEIDLQQAKFFLERGIQPEVWPTEEEFQLAKKRVQYDPEKLHFAVCGSSGSGKSSLINAFRGLKNNSPQAAPTGVVETTMAITRYPDPRRELPYTRLVWFDCPGAGTLEIPGWQYFNEQGLFIFDIIVLVYDSVIVPI